MKTTVIALLLAALVTSLAANISLYREVAYRGLVIEDKIEVGLRFLKNAEFSRKADADMLRKQAATNQELADSVQSYKASIESLFNENARLNRLYDSQKKLLDESIAARTAADDAAKRSPLAASKTATPGSPAAAPDVRPATPPPAPTPPVKKNYIVEYEVRGVPQMAHVAYEGSNGGRQEDVIPSKVWKYKWTATSGDFAYLSLQLNRFAGETTVKISVDGRLIKTNTTKDTYSICDVSYTLP